MILGLIPVDSSMLIMIDRLKAPVFFIGFPRSGTTIIFETFVRVPEFGWLANYAEMWPGFVSANILCRLLDNRFIHLRGHKKQYGKALLGNRFLPQPVEAYEFWDYFTGINFSRDYLLGKTADAAACSRVHSALQRTMKYQGKHRFVTKLTGPGRIKYLSSMFPDAKFVHVIRDGRAAVESLLRVDFWREKGGMGAPFWANGLDAESIRDWEKSGKDPVVLAAHQWKQVIESTRDEASTLAESQYLEVKYEDFVASPQVVSSNLLVWSGLDGVVESTTAEVGVSGFADMNHKYLEILNKDQIAGMNRIMASVLEQLGYSV
jgi:hypothetical protein